MATHKFIDAGGSEAEIQSATGIAYHPQDKAELSQPGWFTYQIKGIPLGSPGHMLALFGAKTLATNTVSSFYEGLPKGAPKGTPRARKSEAPADDVTGLQERFAAIVDGDWGASSGGGGGVGYNLDLLLEAFVGVMAEAGKEVNQVKIATNLRDGGRFKGQDLDAKAYRKAIIGVEGVRAAYEALRTAKAPVTSVDDVDDDDLT